MSRSLPTTHLGPTRTALQTAGARSPSGLSDTPLTGRGSRLNVAGRELCTRLSPPRRVAVVQDLRLRERTVGRVGIGAGNDLAIYLATAASAPRQPHQLR